MRCARRNLELLIDTDHGEDLMGYVASFHKRQPNLRGVRLLLSVRRVVHLKHKLRTRRNFARETRRENRRALSGHIRGQPTDAGKIDAIWRSHKYDRMMHDRWIARYDLR